MSSFANALKSEIARVARKEMKDEILALRKSTTAHRSEIASLKREVKSLTSLLKKAQRAVKTPAAPAEPQKAPPSSRPLRFSVDKLAAHRAYLGISQAQMAKLLRASALSVYKWESGKVQPRAAQLERIATVLKMGKREAAAQLES